MPTIYIIHEVTKNLRNVLSPTAVQILFLYLLYSIVCLIIFCQLLHWKLAI